MKLEMETRDGPEKYKTNKMVSKNDDENTEDKGDIKLSANGD